MLTGLETLVCERCGASRARVGAERATSSSCERSIRSSASVASLPRTSVILGCSNAVTKPRYLLGSSSLSSRGIAPRTGNPVSMAIASRITFS